MKLLSINRASRSNRRLWTLALAGIQLSFATFGSFAQSLPKLMNSALISHPTVDLKTGGRSVLKYLIKPVYKAFGGAMTEK